MLIYVYLLFLGSCNSIVIINHHEFTTMFYSNYSEFIDIVSIIYNQANGEWKNNVEDLKWIAGNLTWIYFLTEWGRDSPGMIFNPYPVGLSLIQWKKLEGVFGDLQDKLIPSGKKVKFEFD